MIKPMWLRVTLGLIILPFMVIQIILYGVWEVIRDCKLKERWRKR